MSDVPGDQGGFVRLQFRAAAAQILPLSPAITQYEVWRRTTPTPASPRGETRSRGREIPASPGAAPPGWVLVASLSPNGSTLYSVVVPTIDDSTGSGLVQDFVVAAKASGAVAVVTSDPVGGYSVDNLAPAPPRNLIGGRLPGGTVRLEWDANTEPDLDHYAIHESSDPVFVPGPGNRIGTSTTTVFDDPHFGPSSNYKVLAVDRHGNESPASPIWHDEITDVPPPMRTPVRP